MPRLLPLPLCCLALAFAGVDAYATEPKVPVTSDRVDFDRDVRPVLSNYCFSCHGPDDRNRKADLRLDTRAGATADLGGYSAVVPGHPDKSEAFRRVVATDPAERMPPRKFNKQMKPADVAVLRRWIEQGADWQEHWSFVPPQRPALPAVKESAWPANGIDRFVLARLEKEGLKPSPPAEREKLLRRVTLDLTGLPPTLTEIDAFLADTVPDAYERIVDRLLASPRYGEHMALAWLDAARYADTNGYQQDATRTMWPWRDWLVRALNENVPYDRFTVEMLAGDLLPDATPQQKLATGFHRNHMLNGEGGRNPEESRVEYVVDRVETTATVWLGLTVGCARCHNHKYDPVSQKDFYRFYAFFNNVDEVGGVDRFGNAKPVLAMPTPAQVERRKKLADELAAANRKLGEVAGAKPFAAWEADARRQLDTKDAKLPDEIAAILRTAGDKRSPEQRKKLDEHFRQSVPEVREAQQKADQARKAVEALDRSVLEVMVMADRPQPRETYVLKRGEWDKADRSELLSPGVPASLPPLPAGEPANRLALAKWLVDPAHPLTARVAVNRAWQHFFGEGLVRTPEDFGSQGERPTHPELLDWLAVDFRDNGWNVTRLHRLIVTSAAYRQSSRVTHELLQRDPYNKLLSRGPRFRLTAQAIRDQALAVSGLLVEKWGGPAVKPYGPDVWFDLSLGKIKYVPDQGENLYRRSLYTFWRRSVGPTMLFDTPARQVCTVRQARTNTPLHALTLMNDTGFVEAARVLAQRLLRDPERATPDQRLAHAFRLATSRAPTAEERRELTLLFDRVLSRYKADPDAARQLVRTGGFPRDEALDPAELAAYTGVVSVVLNLDETVTRE